MIIWAYLVVIINARAGKGLFGAEMEPGRHPYAYLGDSAPLTPLRIRPIKMASQDFTQRIIDFTLIIAIADSKLLGYTSVIYGKQALRASHAGDSNACCGPKSQT